jgi:squalene-hopene/tetraprenyl-beta-curcumene cyclase
MRRPLALASLLALAACGEKAPDPQPAATGSSGEAALAKGAALLRSIQGEDGSFGDPELKLPGMVGYTAMAVGALIGATPRAQREADPAIGKGLAYIVKSQKENGSIWTSDRYVTYETSAAISALALARRSEYRQAQVKAREFLASTQIQDNSEDPSYGGFPYKSKQPQAADLSNLQFAADALGAAELPADHPVWQRIQAYLKRVQNRSEGNTGFVEVTENGEKIVIVAGDDGGAGYAPDQSKAGKDKRPDGKYELRSYGSMTYALLKCLLLAGVDVKDARVVAALGWIAKNWTLELNPGFEKDADPAKAGQQGLFYYYFTAARTLSLYERITKKPLVVKDADGRERDWRKELAERLIALQGADGGWRNPVDRWDEGSRTLVTAYAMQALALALGKMD